MDSPNIQIRSFDFAVRVVKLYRAVARTQEEGRIIARQLLRAGTSIGANVEEAQGAQSKADFITKMSIAHKEAHETHYWLKLLDAAGVLPSARLQPLMEESQSIRKILARILVTAKQRRKQPRGQDAI
ncbi:MAG: four helix bundle protein [Phycisphaeraceae bacterium]